MTIFAPAISKSELWLAVKLLSFLHSKPAPVAKLVDALDLGSRNASCVGSSPIRRTNKEQSGLLFVFFKFTPEKFNFVALTINSQPYEERS